ncbi:TetR/AcrR family transcriptional regulator [Haloferax namakaokahaiae]|uniref:TetR/AcrR family transcriptional regulator n=1 Tax=Haloferax namakaokahaiae TaxID=1748331 RepID=A0ABD5ZA84_9EURY
MYDGPPDTGRSETEQAIMDATLRALATHGYADLSIKNIGTEFDKSTSLLYYHYESKDELLLAFLDYILDIFAASIDPDAEDPDEELREFVSYILTDETDGPEVLAFQRTIIELRAQTIHKESYRAKFGDIETRMIETVKTLIEREIEAGHYREMDAEMMAENLMAFLYRALDVRVTGTRPESIDAMRDSVFFLLDNVMPLSGDPARPEDTSN